MAATQSVCTRTTEEIVRTPIEHICGACGLVVLDADGNKRATPPFHSCKMCSKGLHSYILCESVWMPKCGYYFCSSDCIKMYNRMQLLAANNHLQGDDCIKINSGSKWKEFLAQADVCPLVKKPSSEEEEDKRVSVDASCFAEDAADHVGGEGVNHLPDVNIFGAREYINLDKQIDGGQQILQDGGGRSVSRECGDGRQVEVTDEAVSEELLQLVKPCVRVKMAFKQHDGDEDGLWFGGLIGHILQQDPMLESIVTIAFDDGELCYYTLAELQVN